MKCISDERAKAEFGFSTCHSEMTNGERRFRLKRADGTAYIQTLAGHAGAWQESHFHQVVMETYIVQRGWMAFAQLVGGRLELRLHEAGELVTSRPGVIHNVYLAGGAVIHTVKHGEAIGEDREVDERTRAFDIVTQALATEPEIRAASISIPRVSYSEEYRHFDNLIWQVPAWSTAVFAISMSAIFEIIGSGQDSEMMAAGALAAFSAVCLACFSFVMMRFRSHQRPLKGFASKAWFSASTLTQGLLTAEVSMLLGISLAMFGMKQAVAAVLAGTTWLLLFALEEASVRKVSRGRR